MKKLKVYKNPDFRFVEMIYIQRVIADSHNQLHPETVTPDHNGEEGTGEFDAPVFRPGIWDEE